jgi:hypothetical protein
MTLVHPIQPTYNDTEFQRKNRYMYTSVMDELNYVFQQEYRIKNRIYYFNKMATFSSRIENGAIVILPPEQISWDNSGTIHSRIHRRGFPLVGAYIGPLSPDRSNLFCKIDLLQMNYNYLVRSMKEEYIRTINRFKHICQHCGQPVSPHRYRIRHPFGLQLFCSYSCHFMYYETIDNSERERISRFPGFARPVFHTYTSFSVMENCISPNYWHLRENDEQWEIHWVCETDNHNRYNRSYRDFHLR